MLLEVMCWKTIYRQTMSDNIDITVKSREYRQYNNNTSRYEVLVLDVSAADVEYESDEIEMPISGVEHANYLGTHDFERVFVKNGRLWAETVDKEVDVDGDEMLWVYCYLVQEDDGTVAWEIDDAKAPEPSDEWPEEAIHGETIWTRD
ncbi:hypothetical protein SAMN06269185_1657 [Natronoarchaeum philippinense]|uniref:Uncharacterized protein n=2 Tax=Natronoarchaeum philippinense TaxID=558529 RepID=A0A285NSA5_NATPI|nr:hypothetical protein SAMN06269185_1657 [Natronoarchaeum philippinense]